MNIRPPNSTRSAGVLEDGRLSAPGSLGSTGGIRVAAVLPSSPGPWAAGRGRPAPAGWRRPGRAGPTRR